MTVTEDDDVREGSSGVDADDELFLRCHEFPSSEVIFKEKYERGDGLSRLRCAITDFHRVSRSAVGFGSQTEPSLKPWQDFFFKPIQGRDDLLVGKIADVKHSHEVIGADLLHLI